MSGDHDDAPCDAILDTWCEYVEESIADLHKRIDQVMGALCKCAKSGDKCRFCELLFHD